MDSAAMDAVLSAAVGMPPPRTPRRSRGVAILRHAEEKALPPPTPSRTPAANRVLAAQQTLQAGGHDSIEAIHGALEREGPPPGEAGARFQRLISFLRVNTANVVQSAAVAAEASVCTAQIARALSVRAAAARAGRWTSAPPAASTTQRARSTSAPLPRRCRRGRPSHI
jgi:hypothetical protein